MTERELLTELLAIKLHEHQCFASHMRPVGPQAWTELHDDDRQGVRDLVLQAVSYHELYHPAITA